MSLIVICLGTRYDVCGCNNYKIWPFVYFYDLRPSPMWPSPSVKVTIILITKCTLCCCILVIIMQFLGSIEFEIWTIVWRKPKGCHNDIIIRSILWNSNTYPPRAYLTDKPNSILIGHKRADIHSWEVNRELWRKLGIASLRPWRLSKVINFYMILASAVIFHLAKSA